MANVKSHALRKKEKTAVLLITPETGRLPETMGGLASSTLLNLYVVPAAFAWLFGRRRPLASSDDTPPGGEPVAAGPP